MLSDESAVSAFLSVSAVWELEEERFFPEEVLFLPEELRFFSEEARCFLPEFSEFSVTSAFSVFPDVPSSVICAFFSHSV